MSDNNKHALLSPSSSSRWLNCTPSARLEALEIETSPSEYAEEGTEAHLLAAIKLSYMLGHISPAVYGNQFETFIMTSRYYNSEFNEFVNAYCQEVMDIIKVDYADEPVEVFLEETVKFEDIVPQGSGQSDVVIVGRSFIHIVDLKFGKGVPVSAIDNTQLRLYALGALKTFRLKGIFTKVRMTIIQPRLYDKSTDELTVMFLNDWAETYVKPRAELAFRGEGKFVPGNHCKFCKLKVKCEALAQTQLDTARAEFELAVVDDPVAPTILEPNQMSPEMLARILTIAPKFQDWFKDVVAYATSSMINQGLQLPGYKVVRGRSNRVITDKDKVVEILRTNGYSEEAYLKPVEMLGLTGLEKNIGKKVLDKLVSDYIIKPEGQPTIAPISDPREAIDVNKFKLIGQEFDIKIESEED
jgi:hypothetical protein